MGKTYKERLSSVSTFIFDIDGVFTDGMVQLMPDGQMIRKLSVRDSYAVQYAIKKKFEIAIITGGNSLAVKEGLQYLGVRHIFLESSNKSLVFDKFMSDYGHRPENVLYMGDDIPDYHVMSKVGVAACPSDACEEIKRISHYVSHFPGGHGCVRDIIEQTLKVQNMWFHDDAMEW